MLSLFVLPAICGGIYWLIHKAKGSLTERNKYKRRRLFGYLLLIMIAIEIAFYAVLIFTLANNPEAGAKAGAALGRRFFWVIIGISIGWNWIRLIWTSYEKTQSETDSPEGLGQAIGKWKENLSKKISNTSNDPQKSSGENKSGRRKLKPYEYPPTAPTNEKFQAKITATPPTEAEDKTIENLEKYKEMFEKELISKDEYERLKSKELGI